MKYGRKIIKLAFSVILSTLCRKSFFLLRKQSIKNEVQWCLWWMRPTLEQRVLPLISRSLGTRYHTPPLKDIKNVIKCENEFQSIGKKTKTKSTVPHFSFNLFSSMNLWRSEFDQRGVRVNWGVRVLETRSNGSIVFRLGVFCGPIFWRLFKILYWIGIWEIIAAIFATFYSEFLGLVLLTGTLFYPWGQLTVSIQSMKSSKLFCKLSFQVPNEIVESLFIWFSNTRNVSELKAYVTISAGSWTAT